ncbi:MAG: hypothetical protein VX575_00305 [Pseudomonadota bacterium]|nr:hypothetical protein [Pseudomonadota bacterium]MEC7735006.1 hypothetical protein [Pseudomonadota bacterium]MEC9392259.1 hypothetical protein [Pseudomonadota bacterium]MEC9459485.1 hypothetical protein [Pseudomonadota bacterium]MED5436621.1 hypothetical protein [Pseudomonadota bacterium]
MFDFSFNELLLLSILIIIFIGPKELPAVLRSIHRFFSNLWMYSKEIRTSIESLANDVDIENYDDIKSIKKELDNVSKETKDPNKEI